MHPARSWLACLLFVVGACSSKNPEKPKTCDGMPCPQCDDGIDNDGDGLVDFPNDPGCFAPEQNSEADDCPSGPNCPQCGNGIDDDGNGIIDFSGGDPGCTSAADSLEFTENADACGTSVMIKQLPASGMDTGMIDGSQTFSPISPCGGGGGAIDAVAYELHVLVPKVLVISTAGSTIDTVIDVRNAGCTSPSDERSCDHATNSVTGGSSVTVPVNAGTYYILVESYSGDTGMYTLQVQQFAGVGSACTGDMDCGPSLECKSMVCVAQACRNGIDDDGDGKTDYPNDPGCDTPMDDDETDDCPSGPNCPACGNGIDDDGDGETDYPADTSCSAASGTSEACVTSEGVTQLTMPTTAGDNTGATDDNQLSCAFDSGGLDLTYSLRVPMLTDLTIDVESDELDFDYALLGSTCLAPELACDSFEPHDFGAMAAGTYYLVVDGDDSAEVGAFTVTVSGTIAGNESCESALAQSGALTCAPGFTCTGTVGSRTCTPAQCNNGIDDDSDGKIDYPNDPGCDSASDDDETDPATEPVCSNGSDDDGDGKTDFPADFGCSSAAGASEVFCALETDPVTAITTPTISATLAAKHQDLALDCQADTGNDVTYVLQLPVPVETLAFDTAGSTVEDTVLQFWDTQCDTPGIACDDDTDASTLAALTLTNVPAGNYALTVAGYSTDNNGAYKLATSGTVGAGYACTGTLFTNNVLACATGLTCTAGTCQ